MNNNKTKNLKWYNFHQNNSGGSFTVNDKIDINVIIQAKSPKEANSLAEEIGIYFDGCEKGMDCDCCGDRWHRADKYDESKTPSIYGKPIENYSLVEVTTLNSGEWSFNKQGVKIYPYGTINV